MLATGYIHALIDNNLNFKQFVCNCARAFGTMSHMRDDPSAGIKEAKVILRRFRRTMRKRPIKNNRRNENIG